MNADVQVPPVADVEPVVHELHGVRRLDEYGWLRERDLPRTRAYLAAERAYYETRMSHAQPLRQRLLGEMVARIRPTDESVSWTRGGCVYYTRTVTGKDYEELWRRRPGTVAPELVLDENLLVEDSGYLEVGVREVSPDGAVLAYSVDRDGDEVYRLRFRDLTTGRDLPDAVARSFPGGAWSADSSTFLYVVHDEAYRPFQVWRHRLGTDPQDDVLVLQEDDDRFEVMLERSRSGAYAVVHLVARDTTEAWLLPTDRLDAAPLLVHPRRDGVEYWVSHAPGADGDALVIVTNDHAPEFRLVRVPLGTPGAGHWEEVIGEHPDERLLGVDVFAGHLVLSLRRGGYPLLRILARDGSQPALDVSSNLEGGTIRLDRNEVFDTDRILVCVESYTEPPTWFDVALATGERRLRKRQEVPGYDRTRYLSHRVTVPARDGVPVPVTLVHRDDVALDGSAPCLVYAYGAYEYCFEPEFDAALPSLLDQGVVFAHAHVRGGGELGRRWWQDGRLAAKQHTFDDLVDCADALASGFVDGERLVARGLSAGGLLMGAVFSQAPRRWRGVVAEVPFVDVVTTMLDPSVPLTAQEYAEWGDPRRADEFAWLLAYSPYDNVPPAADRPRLLVTGALHDPRVMYWEPAKWVARLRATGSSDDSVLFRIETGAGSHHGPSGRHARLAYESEVFAWVLDTVGRADARPARSASR